MSSSPTPSSSSEAAPAVASPFDPVGGLRCPLAVVLGTATISSTPASGGRTTQRVANGECGMSGARQRSGLTSIAVTSGKGGVGKTNVAINLAVALARLRHRVAILDADFGLGNVDVLLGLAPSSHIGHVLAGEKQHRRGSGGGSSRRAAHSGELRNGAAHRADDGAVGPASATRSTRSPPTSTT